jgi:hypothetical protein
MKIDSAHPIQSKSEAKRVKDEGPSWLQNKPQVQLPADPAPSLSL